MPKLEWDKTGERTFEAGVEKGILFKLDDAGAYPTGVAWNGLKNFTEKPIGAEPTKVYADNMVYLTMLSTEEYEASLEAVYYPKEFESCDGLVDLSAGVAIGQQSRDTFGLAYITKIGNDVSENIGEILHLVYGCKASPTEKSHDSINESPETTEFSWDITTTPVAVTGQKPTATVTIDSTVVTEAQWAAIIDVVHGGAATSRLPLPDEVKSIIDAAV